MSTPRDFFLEPRSAVGRPSPFPPRYLKRQIYNDPVVFRPVDEHAINEARTNHRNFRDLLWNLIFKKQFNELEKARAIFRWMTTKNLFTIMFDSELPGSPEQVLGSFKDGKVTYAKVFECLAVYSGLYCVTVSGWAKGVDYKPGLPITRSAGNHSWNAIYIDGNWQLVDCHWATRYLTTERRKIQRAEDSSLVYEYDDFYFLTEPSMLIYSHCPEEPAWQLLHPARTMKVYEEYPLVKSYFFSTGMQFLQQNRGIVHTKNGVATLTLGYTRPSTFTFTLGYGEKSVENLQGIQLKRYIIQETTETRVTFYFRSPREGNFYLTIFSQPESTRPRKEQNIFKAACEYKIVCDQPASDIRPFPLCADANWGAGKLVQQYGLVATCRTALLAAQNGRAEIVFRKTRDARIHARLVRDGMDDEMLEKAVGVREQDNLAVIVVILPTTGEYGLEVYANEPMQNGDTFTHVCQYLVAYVDRELGAVYGQVFDRADLAPGMQASSMLYNTPVSQVNSPAPNQGPERAIPSAYLPGRTGTLDSTTSSRRRPPVQEWDGSSIASSRFRDEFDPSKRLVSQMSPRNTIEGHRSRPNASVRKPERDSIANSEFSLDGFGSDFSLQRQQQQQPKRSEESPGKPLEIVFVNDVTEKVPAKKRSGSESDEDKLPPLEVIFLHDKNPRGLDDSFDSLASSLQRGDFNSKDRKQNAKLISQEQRKYMSDSPSLDRENFPPLPPGPAFPGDKTGWLPPGHGGQSHSPSWENSVDFDGPDSRWNSTSVNVEQRNGRNRKPDGQDFGRGSSQGPFDTQTVVPIYHVPYPLGKEHQDGFDPRMYAEPEHEYKPHPQNLYTSSIPIKPPPTFHPIPVHDNDSMPRPAPPTVPPKPFKDTRVFEDVDMHAVEVSREDHKSFRELVWHLIYARNITNELEKARAIFLWLCSKDLSKFNFDDVCRGSPEEILMKLQTGETTYAVVYEILCSYAHLHCKTITGYAKGAEYKPGMRFVGEQGQHSWNAVLVSGAWRLVDCHWAARRLVGKQITVENIRYELDEYYFMPDPHQLIFTHFPSDVNWQLLERSLTLTDFENLVPVKSAFFKYGLQILGHREAVIHTRQEVTIRIGCPPFKAHSLAFTFTLAYGSGKEEYHGMKLNRFGMQEMIDNVSFFTIRPPEKASYRLIIYAKDLDLATREGVYGGVCEYELVCDDHPTHSQSFPPCVHTSWGPGDSISKYNLVPLQKGAIFSTVQGLAEVRFQMPKELRFTAKLKSNGHDEKSLAGYVMNRIVGDVAVFTINTPSRGEYGLEIYANDPDLDGNSLYHAYQYLIICDDELVGPVEPLPGLPAGFLGPQPEFSHFGLVAASHVDPYIQTDTGEIQIAISMSQQLLRVTSQLFYASDYRNDDVSDYVLQQCRGDLIVFFLNLARPGLYKFQIYALPYHDGNDNLPSVYNYLINCTDTHAKLLPFPQQYGQWKEGCYLYEPLEGHLLPSNPSRSGLGFPPIYFRLDVPKALDVVVIVGEQWTPLEQRSSESWEGEVILEMHLGRESKVAVCANFMSNKPKYSTLLEYTI